MKKLAPAPDAKTTAWRIYHDARKGVWVDHFDGKWLVQTRDEQFPAFLQELALGTATSIYWKPRDKAASTAPEFVWGEKVNDRFVVLENGAKFVIDFAAGYSSGIFLDQRLNRKMVGESVSTGHKILNTFAYTGAFSVMGALAGAESSTLDLSQTYLNWARDNFRANDLDPESHHFCKGDTFQWLKTFARQGRQFDGIILDPPTFSRNGKKTFRTDRDYASLVELAGNIVAVGGWVLCCANTHRMDLREFEKQVRIGLRSAGKTNLEIEKKSMPREFHEDDYLKSLRVDVG